MTAATFTLELRLRARLTVAAGMATIALIALVGALYPAFGDAIGSLDLPDGVSNLLGGGNFGSLSGWLSLEVVSIAGPLIVAGVAITCAAATIAGEEEDRILALVLAHPVSRTRLLLAKAGAVTLLVAGLGVADFLGLVLAVALAGGGLSAGHLAAQAVHLALFGLAFGALALALGAATGRSGFAAGAAAGVAILMYLVNGFAPVIRAISWLRFLSLFHYYSGQDPLTHGLDPGGLAVLAAVTLVLVGVAAAALRRRDIHG